MKTKQAGLVFVLSVGAGSSAFGEAPRGSSYAEPHAEAPPVQTLVATEPPTDADLQLKRQPPKLKMRPKTVVAKADPEAAAAVEPAADDGASQISYKMFPTSARDLRERVTFRIRAGVEIDTAPASGETLRGGFALQDNFTDTRPWIAGDAIVGARGIVTPSLNGYFMSGFAFDLSDAVATDSGTIRPYDSFGEQVVVKAGYAEYGREDRKPDDQQPAFWLRAGRQFRLDGGTMFAYFDGATIGYRKEAWNVSAFAGQRVALYVDTEAGILFGGTFTLDLKKAVNLPVKMWANYTGLQITSNDFDGLLEEDSNGDGILDATALDAETRHLMQLGATARLSPKMKLDLRGRLTGLPDVDNTDAGEIPATKFALGRVGGRMHYDTGRLIIIGDVEQRFADDLAYDLATPSAVDILNIADKIGVGMNQPVNATTAGLRIDWQNSKKTTELVAFARTELPNDTPVTVDTKSYVEGGFGIAGAPIGVRGSGVYTTAQYTFRQYTDEGDGDVDMDGDGVVDRIDGACLDLTDLDMDGFPDNCQDFGNSGSSGLDRMHQIAAEAALATRGSGSRRWRFGAGAFFRVYDIQTPYREVKNDARAGGRVDTQLWLSKDLHLNLSGEIAQTSPTLSREIGVMTSFRALMEARW